VTGGTGGIAQTFDSTSGESLAKNKVFNDDFVSAVKVVS
jgi:hypothetical protein